MTTRWVLLFFGLFLFANAENPKFLGVVEGKIKLSANAQARGSVSWLVENGKLIKKGDVVAKFDNKKITEKLESDQEALDQLKEDKLLLLKNFEESVNELDLGIRQITLERDLAKVNWKIIKQGVEGIALTRLQSKISNAEINYNKIKSKFTRSEILFKKGLEEKNKFEQARIDLQIAAYDVKQQKLKLAIQRRLYQIEEKKVKLNLDIKEVILKAAFKNKQYQIQRLKFKIKSKEEDIINKDDRVKKRTVSLKNHQVFSPVDGIAKHSKRHGKTLKVGDRVGRGFAVVDVLDTKLKKIVINVGEKYILKYKKGDQVNIRGIDSGKVVEGFIQKISNAPRDKNESLGPVGRKKGGLSGITVFEVEVNFIDEKQVWTPGFKVNVEIP